MRSFMLLPSLLFYATTHAQSNTTLASQCHCGYRDPTTQEHYTEAIIVYFNETNIVDRSIFKTIDFERRVQKGWNVVYRQGASFENLYVGNNDSLPWQNVIDGTDSSLELFLDSPTFTHLSDGAEVRTVRQDMLYGSFRASMRSAQPWVGGSAMSMYLQYNGSENVEIDMLNMNKASNARVMQLINGEFPSDDLALNYTIIQRGDPPKIPARSPWDFLEVGFDWSKDSLSFWVGDNKTRSVNKNDRSIPSVPQPLYFSHWSTGDTFYMEGPPVNRSGANVRWLRAFFNSSLMTGSEHAAYDQNCTTATVCSTADMTLRGSSQYSAAAADPWQPPKFLRGIRKVAGYIGAGFAFFGVISLINAFVRRTPWYKVKAIYFPDKRRKSTIAIRRSLRASIGVDLASAFPGSSQRHMYKHLEIASPGPLTPAPEYQSPYATDYMSAGALTPLPEYESGDGSPSSSDFKLMPKQSSQSMRSAKHIRNVSLPVPKHKRSISTASAPAPSSARERSPSPGQSMFRIASDGEESDMDDIAAARLRGYEDSDDWSPPGFDPISVAPSDNEEERKKQRFKQPRPAADEKKLAQFLFLRDKKSQTLKFREPFPEFPTGQTVADGLKVRAVPDAMTGAATEDPSTQQKPPPQSTQRIDYLAGLTACACVGVTLRHFSLTFWPFVTSAEPDSMHFRADRILAIIFGTWFLTPLWIGPFFVTSCRFLVQKYFKTGKLNDIGNRMLMRAPRMLIPCFIFMMLEYFFISLGVTGQLEWLPSVSYTTWPYVQPQPNFGVFINEMVELSYLIPNGAPEIINHFCVGVLWTIPVQLQNSFVVLMAAVIVYDIKVTWKRMMVYGLCILTGWYARSWSACHWAGVLLADLAINYDMQAWARAKWYRLYSILLVASLVALGTPLVLLFNTNFHPFPFMAWENGIHPTQTTGRPVLTTVESVYEAYPDFFAPSFAVLLISCSLQVIIELSSWTQAVLSIKPITKLHPHIMTIYLLHGIVFWSLGAYIAVALARINTPYWANLIVTGVCSYTLLGILTKILTPWIEYTVNGCIRHISKWCSEEPVPKRETTAPFSKQLIMGRNMDEPKQEGA